LYLQEYVHLEYRGAEALLASAQALRAALALRAVPASSTLWWCQRDKVKPRLLAHLLTETVGLFRRHDPARTRTVAVEATGFAREQASPYYQHRAGKRHRARTWLQWAVAVWTAPLVLRGQIADRGPREDPVEFRPRVEQTLARRSRSPSVGLAGRSRRVATSNKSNRPCCAA
jgi:hypothetical protein